MHTPNKNPAEKSQSLRHPINTQRGWTLIELVATTAITAILTGMGLSGWSEAVGRHQSRFAVQELMQAVRLARATSALKRQAVTVCPSDNARECSSDWAGGLIVFTDLNKNGRRENAEPIIHRFTPASRGARIAWRAFRSKPWLQMTPQGRTAQQNGSFIYCPGNDNDKLARVVIVNKLGHTRVGRDRNGDGIVETASGKPVSCQWSR